MTAWRTTCAFTPLFAPSVKAAGAVAFTDGVKSVVNAQVMRRALTYAGDFDALVVHHTEDPNLIGDGVMNEGEYAARLGLFGIPKAAETIMLERDLRLVALSEARYHAAAITCAESLAVLRRAKEAGLNVSAAASVNHLTLNEIDIGSYRTFFKVSPPLRSEDDRNALVEALSEGLLDVVMSDHNPQDVETKRLPFAEAAPGAIGLETMLAAGPLKPGSPADVIVADIEAPWVLDPAKLKSKCKNTPFDEARLQGRVLRTIVAGRTVFEYASA